MGVCCPTNREAKDRKNLEDAQGEQPEEPAPRLIHMHSSSFIAKRTGNFYQDFVFVRELGKGSFGETIEVMHKKTKIHRAVKILKTQGISPKEKYEIIKEINTLKELDHPNILKIYEYYEDEQYVFVVGELYTGGELLDKIVSLDSFSEGRAAHLMQQILSAVLYCHDRKIVHRDLKPQNILFDTKLDTAIPKLIDFGASARMEQKKNLTELAGTPVFMAPEVIKKNYTEKCDLWSCGVILYVMLSGRLPFTGFSKHDIAAKILAGKYDFDHPVWKEISTEAQDFISKLLVVDPSKRLSAKEALEHPWITTNTSSPDNHSLTEGALNNLKTYRAQAKLQEAFFHFICAYFARKDEKDEFLKVFQQLDENLDGVLTKEELVQGLSLIQQFGIKEEDIDDIIKQADKNGNGMIDYTGVLSAAGAG